MEYLKEQQARPRKEKKSGKIPYQSKAMQVKNAEYRRVLDEIDEEREPICEVCEKHEFEHSHLIKRDFNGHAYMNVKKNIRRNCRECHLNWESGKLHLLAKDFGRKYLRIVSSLNEQYGQQKIEQFRKRLSEYREKNWLSLSNGQIELPKWVETFFDDDF